MEFLLPSGDKVLVDEEDWEKVKKLNWFKDGWGYAVNVKKRKRTYLHRMINKTPDGFYTDHINGDKLDNRKANLRTCTIAENNRNMRRFKKEGTSTSEYKGVYWAKDRGYWVSQISYDGKWYKVGNFDCEHQAALAYNKKAKELHGDFACLNDIKIKVKEIKPLKSKIIKTSKFKGVTNRKGRYEVKVWFEGKDRYVGSFTDEIEAAKAYNEKAVELKGEKAKLNVIM